VVAQGEGRWRLDVEFENRMLGGEGLDPEAWMREHSGHDAAYSTVRRETRDARREASCVRHEMRDARCESYGMSHTLLLGLAERGTRLGQPTVTHLKGT
jgi:hypothetical protein